jgi:hypothetical protein
LFSKPTEILTMPRNWRAPLFLGATAAASLTLAALRAGAQAPAEGIADAPPAMLEQAIEADQAPPPGEGDPAEADAATRMREGTQLKDRLGRFRQNGESLTFIDDDGRELGGLPNLNLERIIRMLKGVDEPDSVHWSVSGSVTEFGGRNYLLISRAVYKAATLPPPPDAVQ